MSESAWQPLAQSLRSELEEYGALLALVNEQQTRIMGRDAEEVAELATRIASQAETLRLTRQQRQTCVQQMGRQLLPAPSAPSLANLLRQCPAELRALFDALVQEINTVIAVIRRRSQQNQLLLTRLVEVHQMVLPVIRPGGYAKTYNPRGRVRFAFAETAGGRAYSV